MTQPPAPIGPHGDDPTPGSTDDGHADGGKTEANGLESKLDAMLGGAGSSSSSDDLEATLDRALAHTNPVPSSIDSDPVEAALVVLRGRDVGRVYGFSKGSVLIGRAPTAPIRIDDPAVSQLHAMIERVGDRFLVNDLGSANGTSVNGVPITEATPLASGDRVEIVDTMLLFRLGGDLPSHDTVLLDRNPAALALAPLRAEALSRAAVASQVISIASDEERPPTLEERVQKAMVAFAYVRRHWRLLLGLPTAGGVLAIFSLAVLPPPNRAEFIVSLDTSAQENPLQNEPQMTRPRPQREFFHAASETFREGRLIQATLTELGEPNPSPDRVGRLTKKLSFAAINDRMFEGSITDRDGEWAVRFLRTHLELYLAREIEKTLRVYQAEVDLLNTRVEETAARLEKNEDDLRRFREKNLEHLPEFATNRVAAAAGMEGRAGELSAEVTRMRGELRLARERLARESPLIEAKVREAGPYQAALTQANQRLAELRGRGLGPEHPEVRQAEAEAENLRRQVEATTRAAPTDLDRSANPEYTRLKDRIGDLEVQLMGAEKALSAVGGQIGGAGEAMRKLPAVETELNRLTRLVDTDKGLHGRIVERLRQAETQLEIERATAQARYEVVVPPHSIGVALRRNLALRSAIGMAVGMFLAVAWAAIAELIAIVRRLPRVEVVEQRPPAAARAIRRG
ncbi:MAG: FHA domain-containing protein [Polyangiaceae bacterium]|nr:FHA domain-containing protein [Polyangiaceae bacterium]